MLGAGIAGLATAAALARRGLSVEVIEQAPALREVGAGVQIAPNGARVLDALGIDVPHIDSTAVHLLDGPSGRSLLRMPTGPGFRLVHRADLVAALEATARLHGVRLRLGLPVAAVGDGALRLRGGATVPFRRLVGADGARGAAAAALGHADGGERDFTGQVAWRALVPLDAAWPREAQVHVGPGRHLVLYPLRHGAMLNVVAVEERRGWASPSWSVEDDPAALRAAFAGFCAPLRRLLRRVRRVHLWGLHAHRMAPRWHAGRVTLVGDAAHPTLPFLAQGANLALEDAWTLAASWDDPAGWERGRRPRVARALRAARGNARAYHLGGARRAVAHAALRVAGLVAPGLVLRRYDWLYGYDAVATSER